MDALSGMKHQSGGDEGIVCTSAVCVCVCE